MVSIAHRPNVAAFHNQLWELEKTPDGSDARFGLAMRPLPENAIKSA